ALPRLGAIAHRSGARRLLWIGALGITPLPALWLVSGAFPYLLCVQLVSGAAWAAYELANSILFFEAIDGDERTSLLTLFNVWNAAAIVLGAYAGKAVLDFLGSSHAAYLFLFAFSLAARSAVLLMLPRLSRAQPAAPAPSVLIVAGLPERT